MSLTMEHGHHKFLVVINMIQQQFSSNENKKLMLPAKNSLLGKNFDVLNTTIQYYAHTCSIYHECAFDNF